MAGVDVMVRRVDGVATLTPTHWMWRGFDWSLAGYLRTWDINGEGIMIRCDDFTRELLREVRRAGGTWQA